MHYALLYKTQDAHLTSQKRPHKMRPTLELWAPLNINDPQNLFDVC